MAAREESVPRREEVVAGREAALLPREEQINARQAPRRGLEPLPLPRPCPLIPPPYSLARQANVIQRESTISARETALQVHAPAR